jgi:hypothetical protein
MGHHFVPQAYLRAFEDPLQPGMIWVYPRSAGPRIASIEKVAQSSGFYDPSDEADLNAIVERPAFPLLDRLRTGEAITRDEKHVVAVYVATMVHRVPRNQARGEDVMPKALADAAARVLEYVRQLADARGLTPERRNYLLQQVDSAREVVAADLSPQVQAQLRSPWPSSAVVEAVFGMTWRVLLASSPEAFITSDNPAVFFASRGLGNPDSEVILPLSPLRCLHGCRQPSAGGDLSFLTPEKEIIREMNRRVAREATSVILSHRKVPDLMALLKRKPRLHKVHWS